MKVLFGRFQFFINIPISWIFGNIFKVQPSVLPLNLKSMELCNGTHVLLHIYLFHLMTLNLVIVIFFSKGQLFSFAIRHIVNYLIGHDLPSWKLNNLVSIFIYLLTFFVYLLIYSLFGVKQPLWVPLLTCKCKIFGVEANNRNSMIYQFIITIH